MRAARARREPLPPSAAGPPARDAAGAGGTSGRGSAAPRGRPEGGGRGRAAPPRGWGRRGGRGGGRAGRRGSPRPGTPRAQPVPGGWGRRERAVNKRGSGVAQAASPPPWLPVDKAFGAARAWAPLQGLEPPGFQKEKSAAKWLFFFFIVK